MAAAASPPPAMPALLEGCTDNQAIARRIKELRTTGGLKTKDSYSELLGTLAQRAMWRQACTLLLEMRFRAMKPFPPSYALVATACCKASQPDEAARVIDRLWTAQAMDLIGCGAVLSRFANAGLWKEALAFLRRMPQERVAPDTYAYNNVFASVRRANSSIEASQLLAEMQEEELRPDDYTYSLAIDCEKDAGRWEMALSHFRSMQANHIEGNTVVYSAAINACRLGLRPYLAMELLEDMKEKEIAPDVQVYTATIDSFGTASLWENALDVLDAMRPQGVSPNAFSYNVALSACQRALQWEEALQLFRSMQRDKLNPSTMDYDMILSACARSSEKGMIESLLNEMNRKGVLPSEVTFNCLASLPSTPEERASFISKLRSSKMKPDVRTYNPMISACAETGGWQDAVMVLEEMRAAHVPPDLQSHNRFLSVCAATGSWDLVLQVFHDLVQGGFKPDRTSINTCISACATTGQWHQAVLLLLDMETQGPPPDVISYNAMIYACRKERPEWALAFLDRMRLAKVPPDVISYNSVMQACGEASLWEHVLSGLYDMEHHGIIPSLDSYYIAIEKLLRAGQTPKALELFQSPRMRGLKIDQGCYNNLIIGALRAGSVEWAEHLVRKAQEEGTFERGSKTTVDLHVMRVPVAQFVVLTALRDRARAEVKQGLTIITGIGRHSKDEAVIKPMVMALLQELQLPCRLLDGAGHVQVKARFMTSDLARRIERLLSTEELRQFASLDIDDAADRKSVV